MTQTHEELNRQAVALRRQGRNDQAMECYRRALRVKPDFAEAHYNLGLLCCDLGRVVEAIECFQRVVQLRPDIAVAHYGLGNALAHSGRKADAQASYRRAIARMPEHAEANARLAVLLCESGDYEAAERPLRVALQSKPNDPRLLVNLGNVLKQCGKVGQACECYAMAIQIDSRFWQAVVNLANTHMERSNYDEAMAGFRRAVELQPDGAEVYLRMAHALANMKQRAEAVAMYEKAIEQDRCLADAHVGLGYLLNGGGEFDRARHAFRMAAKAAPDNAIHRLREATLCPLVFRSRNELETYRRRFEQTARSLADAAVDVPLAKVPRGFCECPYNLQFVDGNLKDVKVAFARVFQAYFEKNNAQYPLVERKRPRRSRPRIGLVVTHGHERAFVRSLGEIVRRLDRDRLDLSIVCARGQTDAFRTKLGDAISFVEYPERFDWAVDRIRAAHLDLLYYWEIGTDPVNYFLPFLRLAPVQCTSWGIQVTSGIPQVDYYLSSDLVEPTDADDHYSERLIRTRSLLTYQDVERRLPESNREKYGFSNDQHLYGCLQNLGKFHPDFDVVLGEILRRDPDGWLLLGEDAGGNAARGLRERFSETIADVAPRIVFLPTLTQREYLTLIGACDVLLEPLHFGGVNTTYDAFSVEKPLVTIASQFHRGRYGAACYQKMGLEEIVASGCSEYVSQAVQLGCDAEYCRHLSEQIGSARHTLFEDLLSVAEHERIFLDLTADVN